MFCQHDWAPLPQYIDILKEETTFLWTTARYWVRKFMLCDGMPIQPIWAIKLSKALNASTTIGQKGTSCISLMKVLGHYAGSFELKYSMKHVYARAKNSFQDPQPSNYLPTRSEGTYTWYIRFTKLILRKGGNRAFQNSQAWEFRWNVPGRFFARYSGVALFRA